MPIRTSVTVPGGICMVLLAVVAGARAETTCNERIVRERLAAMEEAFRSPDVQAKLSAAKEDWVADNDFDNDDNGKYLGTVATYHDMKRNFDAGAVDGACESLTRTDAMVRAVLGEL